MTPATDGMMLMLVAIHCKGDVRPTADRDGLELTVENGAVPADALAFDELESRQWVVVDEAGVRVTERGVWWLKKWLRKEHGVELTARTRVAATVRGAK